VIHAPGGEIAPVRRIGAPGRGGLARRDETGGGSDRELKGFLPGIRRRCRHRNELVAHAGRLHLLSFERSITEAPGMYDKGCYRTFASHFLTWSAPENWPAPGRSAGGRHSRELCAGDRRGGRVRPASGLRRGPSVAAEILALSLVLRGETGVLVLLLPRESWNRRRPRHQGHTRHAVSVSAG
jgi:hypothetical protein